MNPRPDAPPNPEDAKPFLDHLEEFRQAVIKSAIALAVGVAIAFPFAPQILGLLKAPLADIVEDPDAFLMSVEVTGAFTVALRVALWAGLLVAVPFLVYFIGGFIAPGLKPREKQMIVKSAGFAIALFFMGVSLGYFVTLPVALKMMFGLHEWLGIRAMPTMTSYVAFSIQLLIGFGLAFQMPVIVLILGKLGILSSLQLRQSRRYVIVLLLVVAMILTPPDIFTQLIMAVPLIILFELCIWILRASEKKGASET